MFRVGQLLNCVFERTPESLVYEALTKLQDEYQGMNMVEYTSTESVVLESVTGRFHYKYNGGSSIV